MVRNGWSDGDGTKAVVPLQGGGGGGFSLDSSCEWRMGRKADGRRHGCLSLPFPKFNRCLRGGRRVQPQSKRGRRMTDGKGRKDVRGMVVTGIILKTCFPIPLTDIRLTLNLSRKMTDRESFWSCVTLPDAVQAPPKNARKGRPVKPSQTQSNQKGGLTGGLTGKPRHSDRLLPKKTIL